MKKYSLHIGVNKADAAHYGAALEELPSCHNDAKAMLSLAKHIGFTESRILLDEQATVLAVKEAITSHANDLEKGDFLFISYSGHGGRIPSSKKQTHEDERIDQTWCLYDRQLLDDELAYLWPLFKAGVHILVFLDSCHSGSAVRDRVKNKEALAIQRELKAFFKEEGAIKKALPSYSESPLYFKHQEQYDAVIEQHLAEPPPMQASLQLFSACQDEQEARAGSTFSYFTLAFIQVMIRRWNRISNYEVLFDMLKQQALKTQLPNSLKIGKEDSFFSDNLPFLLSGESYPEDLGMLFRNLKNLNFE